MGRGETKLRGEPKSRKVTGKILTNLDRRGVTILFLKKRFVLYLEPDRVALVRGQDPVVHAMVRPGSTAGDFSWDALGAAMRDVLGRRRHRRGDRGSIDVLLSAGLCQLALVKGATGALAADEAQALARHCFRPKPAGMPEGPLGAIFRVSPVKGVAGQRHLLCAALDAAGLDHIRQSLPEGAWSLGALRPRLVGIAAGLARELDRFSGHLICADSRSAVLVALREGSWQQVMTRRRATDRTPPEAELRQMLEQSEALSATGSRQVWWCGAPISGAQPPGWSFRLLPRTGVSWS
jgi:hypothetical protein